MTTHTHRNISNYAIILQLSVYLFGLFNELNLALFSPTNAVKHCLISLLPGISGAYLIALLYLQVLKNRLAFRYEETQSNLVSVFPSFTQLLVSACDASKTGVRERDEKKRGKDLCI